MHCGQPILLSVPLTWKSRMRTRGIYYAVLFLLLITIQKKKHVASAAESCWTYPHMSFSRSRPLATNFDGTVYLVQAEAAGHPHVVVTTNEWYLLVTHRSFKESFNICDITIDWTYTL